MAAGDADGSASIGTSEYFLVSQSTSKTDRTVDVFAQILMDFGAMLAADVYEYRVLEKVNGNTQRNVIGPLRLVGVQAIPVWIPGVYLKDGWEIGVKKISGTDRTIYWSIRAVAVTYLTSGL